MTWSLSLSGTCSEVQDQLAKHPVPTHADGEQFEAARTLIGAELAAGADDRNVNVNAYGHAGESSRNLSVNVSS